MEECVKMKIKKFWAFQISKTIIFEVEYIQLRGNNAPDFSTQANKFNRPKTDWERCGQAQKDLLPKSSNAYKFWEKWDKKHLQDLTDKEYNDLLKDIEFLKECYNFIEQEQDESLNKEFLTFDELRELSMKKPKIKTQGVRL